MTQQDKEVCIIRVLQLKCLKRIQNFVARATVSVVIMYYQSRL